MYLPKKDIYNSLKSLGYSVEQTQPDAFIDLPCIIFKIDDNSIDLDLDNNIASQSIEVQIDIWDETSVGSSKVLSEVEEIMRSNEYKMTYSNDVPNSGNLYHIVNRFTKII